MDFFQNQLTEEPVSDQNQFLDYIPRLITEEDNTNLLLIPSIKEVYEAVTSIPRESAPGPDGFTSAFFISSWDIISEDVMEAVQQFFQGVPISQAYTSSIIALIPKTENPKSFSDMRPISLCQVIYKVFSKILANRLAALMPRLVSLNQAGFTQGRNIAENIALAQELTNNLKKEARGSNVILEIDMSKAFDRINWAFLMKVLQAFGFSSSWISLLASCVCNNFFSVSFKGIQSGYFKSSRGLRQGDPISPLLFVLSDETLSRGLNHLLLNGKLVPFSVPRFAFPVSHILFADDCIIFANGTKSNLLNLKNFLDLYAEESGQKINLSKSSFYIHPTVSETRKQIIASTLQFSEGHFPIQYLGAPLSYKSLSAKDYDGLIAKITKKVASWKGAFLTMGGKVVLLKAVLSSLPIHLLAVLKPPELVLHKLKQLFTHFFWGSHEGKSKKAWISWDKITRSYAEGGLEIKKIHDIMSSLHAKLTWNIITQDGLFSQFMRAKYNLGSEFRKTNSPLWKAILNQWAFVQSNTTKINNTWVWKPSATGKFTVKSAWDLIRNTSMSWSIATYVWKSYVPMKINVFLWKLWHKGVPTDDNIIKCGIQLASKCSCCIKPDVESIEHLFSQGELAWRAWSTIANRFGVILHRHMSLQSKCLHWWTRFKGDSQDQLLAAAVPAIIVWSIWLTRNDIRYEDKSLASSSVSFMIQHWLSEINLLIKPKSPPTFNGILSLQSLHLIPKQIMIKKPILVEWKPPTYGIWKLNIDGASSAGIKAGCGGIVRNSFSEILFAFSEFLGEGSNNFAELSGLYVGLLLCYQLGIAQILIETDSLLVLHWVHKVSYPPWRLWGLWLQVFELLSWIDVKMVHTYREGNFVADALAKQGSNGVTDQYWFVSDLRQPVLGAWCSDALGLPSWRQPK